MSELVSNFECETKKPLVNLKISVNRLTLKMAVHQHSSSELHKVVLLFFNQKLLIGFDFVRHQSPYLIIFRHQIPQIAF